MSYLVICLSALADELPRFEKSELGFFCYRLLDRNYAVSVLSGFL